MSPCTQASLDQRIFLPASTAFPVGLYWEGVRAQRMAHPTGAVSGADHFPKNQKQHKKPMTTRT
jgi:hypothetical protein